VLNKIPLIMQED